MLEIKNVTKVYDTNGFRQEALCGVSMNFRDHEFVSILGQSGSGKTTLLNIVGGLDQYTDGNLIINGVETKNYKDRDWDAYRNHKIGFIFQSYNLIPHQTILANVELALTLSGVSKRERKERAIAALKQVGLEEHIHKKPNQLSGGQMQRVAIARALINDPDIILADEPTGALDSSTAESVMETIKDISKDKLIIMVTHNPELAEEYSSRIIRLKDGVVTDDTCPYTDDEVERDKKMMADREAKAQRKRQKRTHMGLWTAISLSLKNLMSKKGRTALTSVAGSIGIIGIALILAVSTGVQNYIDAVQQDTLASFPIQIEKETTDMGSLMSALMGVEESGGEDKGNRDGVYGNPVMYKMMKAMLNAEVNTNNLQALKEYIDAHQEEFAKYSTAIQYGYKINLNVYAKDPNGEYAKADFMDLVNGVMEGGSMMSGISSMMQGAGSMNVWQELLTDPNTKEISSLISDQYDLVYGKWPTEKNEILLVLNENNEISDVTLYSLGLVDRQTMMNATLAAMMGKEDHGWDEFEGTSWTYEEICNIPLQMILPTDYYRKEPTSNLWVNISSNQALLNSVIDDGLTLNITGIVKPSEDATAAFLNGSLCYTSALTEYYIDALNNSEMIKEQRANVSYNIINGLPFVLEDVTDLTDAEKIQAFKEYVDGLTDNEKAKLYESILAKPSDDFVQTTVNSLLEMYAEASVEDIVKDITDKYASQLGYSPDLIQDMLGGYNKDDLMAILEQTVRDMIIQQYQEQARVTIETICNAPSEAELESLRAMILMEMYKNLESLPPEQIDAMKHHMHVGFVAQYWSENTGIDTLEAMNMLGMMDQESFQKLFDRALNDTAAKYYTQFGGTSSSADRDAKVAAALEQYLQTLTDEDLVYCYDNHMPDKVSEASFNDVLKSLGVKTAENPDFIYIYPVDFECKDTLAEMIEDYNAGVDKEDKIEYTDIAAMLMSSVSSIITAISVVLIGFVSISLIVSSIMIGIITYISVLERTKEIGILRAVGASKRDISRVFNAETVIVGFLAGIVGIATTLILCVPISLIAREVTGIMSLTAELPWYGYFLIVLSVVLTLIAGLLPAGMAARKDPVEALRTE